MRSRSECPPQPRPWPLTNQRQVQPPGHCRHPRRASGPRSGVAGDAGRSRSHSCSHAVTACANSRLYGHLDFTPTVTHHSATLRTKRTSHCELLSAYRNANRLRTHVTLRKIKPYIIRFECRYRNRSASGYRKSSIGTLIPNEGSLAPSGVERQVVLP